MIYFIITSEVLMLLYLIDILVLSQLISHHVLHQLVFTSDSNKTKIRVKYQCIAPLREMNFITLSMISVVMCFVHYHVV